MTRSKFGVLRNAALLAGTLLLIAPHVAHAYIDPGTGSMVLQLLAAGLVSAALIFRRSLMRVLGLFRRGRK
jgi:hypothetical protein